MYTVWHVDKYKITFKLVIKETVIKEIEQNQLTWYGHVQRMAEERLPKIALKWMPKQKWARGGPKKNWMEGIKKAMNERNLSEGQWEDRKQCSLGVGQRRKTFWTRYIHTDINHWTNEILQHIVVSSGPAIEKHCSQELSQHEGRMTKNMDTSVRGEALLADWKGDRNSARHNFRCCFNKS